MNGNTDGSVERKKRKRKKRKRKKTIQIEMKRKCLYYYYFQSYDLLKQDSVGHSGYTEVKLY
jgi:hypothetical protein